MSPFHLYMSLTHIPTDYPSTESCCATSRVLNAHSVPDPVPRASLHPHPHSITATIKEGASALPLLARCHVSVHEAFQVHASAPLTPVGLGHCLRKWRHGEVQCLGQGHATVRWESLPQAQSPCTYMQHIIQPPRDKTLHVAGYTQVISMARQESYVHLRGATDQDGDLLLRWTSVYATRLGLTSCRKLH